MDCLARRRNGWSFRLYEEMKISDSACFMTLTYGHDKKSGFGNDPPVTFNGHHTLEKKDLQLFIKRLRKYQKKKLDYGRTIKYYAVGEYGSHTHRPHYHVVFFNLHPDIIGNSLQVAKKLWTHGAIDISNCNMLTICYTVGYIMKGSWQPTRDDDDRNPEFAIMSKKLGSSYLTPEIYEYHQDRLDTTVMHPSGFRIPLPRYYRDEIFGDEEKADLYEINQKLIEMDWLEFVNYDFKKEVMHKNDKIRKHEKKLATTRNLL